MCLWLHYELFQRVRLYVYKCVRLYVYRQRRCILLTALIPDHCCETWMAHAMNTGIRRSTAVRSCFSVYVCTDWDLRASTFISSISSSTSKYPLSLLIAKNRTILFHTHIIFFFNCLTDCRSVLETHNIMFFEVAWTVKWDYQKSKTMLPISHSGTCRGK